jgi:hypothetical protein
MAAAFTILCRKRGRDIEIQGRKGKGWNVSWHLVKICGFMIFCRLAQTDTWRLKYLMVQSTLALNAF